MKLFTANKNFGFRVRLIGELVPDFIFFFQRIKGFFHFDLVNFTPRKSGNFG
jgi:hypothetical protein